jgi:succinate-semialdehyde dehydrogenase
LSQEDVKVAIDSSFNAQKIWAGITAKERSVLLRKWYNLIMENQTNLAKIITLEQGKPLAEALTEVSYGASFIEWYAEEAKRVYGDVVPPTINDRRILLLKQPVGVACLITPWNFPIAMMTRMAAPALGSGCSAIVKPSEETPLSALAIAELAHEAGIPPGVLNIVTCSRNSVESVSHTLLKDQRISKLAFTGSTVIGKKLMASCADTVKKVSLELGGNAPFIVFNSADISTAVKGAISGKFRNTGQTCVSPNRILVQRDVHDEFVEAFCKQVSSLKVGDGFDQSINQGPLITPSAVIKVESHIQDAKERGAEVILGGTKIANLPDTFYTPSVVINVDQNMLITREETFGPVAPIIKFDNEEEAVMLANATQYGLAAYFYSSDVNQIWRVAEGLEAGIVGVNEALVSTEVATFGGVKQSGIGLEGSKYGIDEYLIVKHVCMGNLKFS